MSSSELAIYGISSSRRVKENVGVSRLRSATPSSSSTPHAPRQKAGQRDNHSWMANRSRQLAERRRMTVKDVLSETDNDNISYVRPFRIPQHHIVPEGVPPLQMGKLKKSDDMEPIAIRNYAESRQPSSHLSWGRGFQDLVTSQPLEHPATPSFQPSTVPSHQSLTSLSQQVPVDVPCLDLSALKKGRDVEESQRTLPPKPLVRRAWVEEPQESEQQAKKHSVVDDALERTVAGASIQTQQRSIRKLRETPPLFTGGHQIARFSRTRHSSSVLSAPEMAMSDRVRFNARVVTSNGRDIHRELCGFFFAQDSSLTLYEFRQLSSRSSALPLIQRRAYSHARGARAGQPIALADIKLGVSLTFTSSGQLSLPASMKCRRYVEVRMTDVDDVAKERVGQHYQMRRDDHDRQPTHAENEVASLVSAIQAQVYSQIRGRTCHVWLALTRHLSHLNRSGDCLVTWSEFTHALTMYHIRINEQDLKRLGSLLYGSEADMVDISEFLHCCLGDMSEPRHLPVRKAFMKMDSQKTGCVLVSEMKKFFNPRGHPDVRNGRRTEYEVSQELFSTVAGPRLKELTYAEFEAFYQGTSMNMDDDVTFIELMKRCWNV